MQHTEQLAPRVAATSQGGIKHARALIKTKKTPKNSPAIKNTKKLQKNKGLERGAQGGTSAHIGVSNYPIWAATT